MKPGNGSRRPAGAGPESRGRTATIVILAVLFAAGAFHWIWFLNYGRMDFKPYDWGKEFIYYSVLRQAVSSGTMPYHISLAFHGSNRFLALPEVNLSPQIFLLPAMSVGTFVVFNTLILYSAGFVGSLLLRRRYRLSLAAFAMFFLLFNFNGHVTAHMGVGHSMWAGYFLLPFLMLFLLELLDGEPWRSTSVKLALALFFILLQGSFHLFVWCLLFLALMLAFNWRRYYKPLVTTVALSAVFSAHRLLPALFALWGKKEKFIWSYPTPLELLDALTSIREHTPDRLRPWGTAGWWEYDAYIGLVGLAVLVGFGVWLRWSRNPDLDRYKYPPLDLPLAAMTLLSMSYFHAFITRIPIPLLKSERVAMRFIVVPLVVLTVLSAIRMGPTLARIGRGFKFRFVAVGALVLTALSFLDHSYLWSVGRLGRQFASKDVDLTIPPIQSQADGFYKTMVVASIAVSAAAVVAAIYAAVRLRGRERSA
ncbi:MAG: hypothetical protein WAW06_09065 [bacterium]